MVAKKIVITEPVEEAAKEAAVAKAAPPPDEPEATEEPSPDTTDDTPESAPSEPESESEPEPEPEPEPAEEPAEPESPEQPLSKSRSLPRPSATTSPVRGLLKGIRRQRRAIAFFVLAVIIGIAVTHLLTKPASNPLPKSLQQKANFTLYYPHSSVGKYKYVSDSGSYAAGRLTYNLGAGGPVIRITEQALTVQAPDLHKLQGFSVFQTPNGQAAVGASGNVLNGILITHKTLIILNGLNGVSRQDFTRTINSLGS